MFPSSVCPDIQKTPLSRLTTNGSTEFFEIT